MGVIINWDQYLYSFPSNYQTDLIVSVIDHFQTEEEHLYFSQFASLTTSEIADSIKDLPGDADTNDIYVDFAAVAYALKTGVSGSTEIAKWEAYINKFKVEFPVTGIQMMVKELRNTYTWSTFIAGASTIITDHFDSYPDTRRQVIKDFAVMLNRKAREIENSWLAMEISFQDSPEEQKAFTEFSYFLQGLPVFQDFENFQKITPEGLATYLRSFIKSHNNPRIYADFIANDFKEKAQRIAKSNVSFFRASSLFIDSFRQNWRDGVKTFIQDLSAKNIASNIQDLALLPALTGVYDIWDCSGDDTDPGHEILLNGDFSLSTGGWYDVLGAPLTNLKGKSGLNSFPYTGNIIKEDKRYKISLNVLSIATGSTIKDASANILYTATSKGKKHFFYTATADTNLKFEISLFDDVSIVEIPLGTSCEMVVIEQETTPSLPQISHILTDFGAVAIGDVYMLKLNGRSPLYCEATAATVANLTSVITSAINTAASNNVGDWDEVGATDDTTKVIVTGVDDHESFILNITSIKKELLSLSADHNLYRGMALDILSRVPSIPIVSQYLSYNFNGILRDSTTDNPLPNYQVRGWYVKSGVPTLIGQQTTASNGYFSFVYNVPKPFEQYSTIKVEVMSDGFVLAYNTYSIANGSEAINILEYELEEVVIESPEITLVASLISLTIPSELASFLTTNNIVTLQDIRDAGGLKFMVGLPVATDHAAVVALDSHANLNVISYDIMANQSMINQGYKSLYEMGISSRTNVVNSYMGSQPGGFNALRIHTLSKSYANFFQNQLVAHRASSNISSSLGTIQELDSVLEEKCICDDCNAAVSPLAYLTDLISYATKNAKNSSSGSVGQLTIAFLEDKFYQNFEQLSASCEDVEAKICQQRVVVEILRRYLLAHTPAEPTLLATRVHEYCVNVYRYLLIQIGTSYEELRQIRMGANSVEKKEKLAKRLKIPFEDGVIDPFTTLFIDVKSVNLTEAFLEKVFGLVDTSRDHMCDGLEIGDSGSQISKWHFRGVEWNKNTDENGFIYAKIVNSGPYIELYKKSTRLVGDLVATAELITGIKYAIAPENESGLSGEFSCSNTTNNSSISFSVIPQLVAWRLQYLRANWLKQEHKESAYIDHTIPIIDPDIIGPDDFRNPSIADPKFLVWSNRRTWVDEIIIDFRALGTNIASMFALMDNSVDYITLAAATKTHAIWDTVPSDENFKQYYNHLKNGTEIQYDEALEIITNDLHLTTISFFRLYEIYAATKVNDEKGIINETKLEAGEELKKLVHITPVSVNKGDFFELTITISPTSTTVSYLAEEGDTVMSVVSALKTAIDPPVDPNPGAWANVSADDSGETYIAIEANDPEEPFEISYKVYRASSTEELEEVISILTQCTKKVFYQDWIDEENLAAITLNANDFWNSLAEPVMGTWPVEAEEDDNIPLIDPDILNIKELPEYTAGIAAINLWYDRQEVLNEKKEELRVFRETEGVASAYEEAWGASYLGTYDSLEDLFANLNSITPAEIADAITHIETVLFITEEEFREQIMFVQQKNSGNSTELISKEQWSDFYRVLTLAYKKRSLYADWEAAEDTLVYWKTHKAKLPLWRASVDERKTWKKSLEMVRKMPHIEPDIIRPDFLKSIDTGSAIFTLWDDRNNYLLELFDEIKLLRIDEEEHDTELEGFDAIIKEYIVDTEESAVLIGLYELLLLGEDISGQLAQYNLTGESLKFLLDIRDLAVEAGEDPSSILEDEWNEVYSIVLKARKERRYSTWNLEEREASIILSPDFFKVSNYKNDDFSTEDRLHQVIWRYSEKAKKEWVNSLDARVTQELAIYENAKNIVDKAEEEWMKILRDALVMATGAENIKLEVKAKAISDKLMLDAENNCCQKTTRISQAIEALQGMFYSIRNGIIQDTYPELSLVLTTDHFDEEWTWMGSYATWRAAMFVNIYPENLLYPTYRKNQTVGFRIFAEAIRNDNRLTPQKALKQVQEYFNYFKDVSKLTLVASCAGRTISYNGVQPSGIGFYKDLQYLFALGNASGKYYWSTIDVNSTNEYAHSSWAPLGAFDKVTVSKALGAVAWRKSDNEKFVLFFALIRKDEKDKIGYAKLNLDTGVWDTEIVELDIDKDNATDVFTNAALNIENGLIPSDEINIALLISDKLIVRKLNKKGTELEATDNLPFVNISYRVVNETTAFGIKITALHSFINRKLIYEKTSYEQIGTTRVGPPVITSVQITLQNASLSFAEGQEADLENAIKADFIAGNIDATGVYPKPTATEPGMVNYTISYNYPTVPKYSEVGTRSLFMGNVVLALNYQELISSFIWPDNDPHNNNNYIYLVYKTNKKSQFISYKHYRYDGTPVSSTVYAFENDLKYATTYQDFHGNVFLLYQQASTGSAICRAPLLKNTSTHTIEKDNNGLVWKLNPSANGFQVYDGLKPGQSYELKTRIRMTYFENEDRPRSEFEYIQEAYYFVPMLVALSLQDKGYYTKALDWFRMVYDYSIPIETVGNNIRPRKIWYGLIMEEDRVSDYRRVDNWLSDPLNPHALAETRQNLYSRYTVLSIVQCLLAFADSEFAQDTAESVPRARYMYEEALELLEAEGLRSPSTDCVTTIDDLDFEPTDEPEWPEWKAVWLSIKADLIRLKDKDIITNVIDLISTELETEHDLSQKMSVCRDIVDDALETPDFFVNITDIITDDLDMTKDAITRMMLDPSLSFITADMAHKLSEAYMNSVSLVTALPIETLVRTDFSLAWVHQDRSLVTSLATPNSFQSAMGSYPLMTDSVSNNRVYYNFVAPSQEQILTLSLINDPLLVVNSYYNRSTFYIPSPNIAFCIPPNPVLTGLYLNAELNLYKLRNCMNIAGMVRELDPYAAPTDQTTGLPQVGGDGTLNLNIKKQFNPSQFRFEVILERARQQVQVAQQLEASLLSLFEKADAERYSILKARQDLGLAKAGVRLQDLRLKVADSSISLAVMQKERVQISQNYYRGLIAQGLLGTEIASLTLLKVSAQLQQQAALLLVTGGVLSTMKLTGTSFINDLGSALTGAGNGLSTIAGGLGTSSQIQSMLASFERRAQEWQFQVELGNQDLKIGDQQIRIANQQKDVVTQERQISQLQVDNAEATVSFLQNKFTNVELYEWMTRVLTKVYSYFLQQATSTAQTAMNQLAFERQENVPSIIKNDYWEAPNESGGLSLSSGGGPDRQGLTSSTRLLQDIAKLDQFAFDTDKRKMQLTKVFSLASLDPVSFQKFRETGVLHFATPTKIFDNDFPGHYLRLVKRVKMSVIALISPIDGIKATLSNAGLSRGVTRNGYQFETTTIKRDPESIAFTSPIDATGVFDLNQVSTKLNPFESIGVDTNWEFNLPKAANFFDYTSIADVLFTMEYTALESFDYRTILLKERDGEPIESVRAFNFVNQFADQWYDLNNPLTAGAATVNFDTRVVDFPANMESLAILGVTLFFVPKNASIDIKIEAEEIDLTFTKEGENFSVLDKVPISPGNIIQEPTDYIDSVEGDWSLSLPKTIVDKIVAKEITDILFAIKYEATPPAWPGFTIKS